jgi:hypothetical protein
VICDGHIGPRPGFLRILSFPLSILIQPVAPYSLTTLSPTVSKQHY